MGKTIRFNESSLIAIKKGLNEIMAGSDDIVSHNDVSAVKLYHGTTIDALLAIMETGVMSAKRGRQHGETYGVNWFSLKNGDNFNRGAVFSIEVPGDVFNERFRMMNNSEAVSKDDDLDVTSFNLTIEKICGLSREAIKRAYGRYVSNGDRYPLESIGYLFYHFIERVQDDDVLFPDLLRRNWDKYYPMIMKNILGDGVVNENKHKKELDDNISSEFAPVTEIGAEPNSPMGGTYYHKKQTNESVMSESKVPQEFIDRANELRPNRFSNWAVINLNDINLMPQYFEKRSSALEYYKWVKNNPKNKAVIVNLDESINFNKNGLSINDDKILDKYNLKDLILSKNGNYVTLNKIVANEFGNGYGSRFMEELTKIADENGWILALTPDTSFGGTSVGRLKNFYKRFGFKPNNGRNADFNTRESMVRKPLNENKYDDLFNKAINDLENFRKQGAEKYGEQNWYAFSWMKKMHPDIEIDPNDIKIYNALLKKYEEVTKLWNAEDEAETVSQQAEETSYDVISLAIEQYGTTSNLGQAGYILPDGRLLNFGSNGYREEDHRGIKGIYKKNNIPIWSDEYRYNYVVDFMNHGAIRCCVNSGILDMTKEPTKEQYFTIRAFVRKACDVDIDFTNDKGDTQHSVSYSNAKPQQVVADIYKYYNEGIKPQGNVQFESKNNKKIIIPEDKLDVIKENIEPEVASSEVDLSSFKKRDTLPPGIWKDEDTLDSRVRLKLLDIADDFWEFINLSWVEPKGIIITGSICNFNWSKFSDIDLHIIADFREIDEKTEFVKQYLDSKKNEWNKEHEGLKIMGFPVELYVQNVDDDIEAGGIYDLEENKWVRKPNPHSIKSIGLNKFNIKDKAAEIMTIIDDMYDKLSNTSDGHEIDQIGEDAHYLWDKVKDLRKKSLNKNGESGSGNIVYKVLRRTGYLDKLFKLFSTVYDRTNSISESMKRYLTVLKEEVAIDGSSEDNPYEKRWKAEREALKSFVANYGKLMQSREDNKGGKLYKVYFDETMSNLIGYNYCICVQWNEQEMKPGSTVYIRALDKFTPFIRRDLQFDTRGRDNVRGTYDDNGY